MASVSLRQQISNRLLRILGTYVLGFTVLIFLLALASVFFFHHSQLRQYQTLIATKLSAELSAIVRESDSVGNSSVVWTGLTDSAGRETYLEPLLAKINRKARIIICGAITGPMFIEPGETGLDYTLGSMAPISVRFTH